MKRVALITVLAAVLGLYSQAGAAPVAPGYVVNNYISGVDSQTMPTALAFSPDGAFGRPSELYVAFDRNTSGGNSHQLWRVPSAGTAVFFGNYTDTMGMQFSNPASAFGTYLYGSSRMAGGVVRFGADGNETRFASWSGMGTYGASFSPGGNWGNQFYVLDENGTIQRFDANGARTTLTSGLPTNDKGMDFSPGGAWGDYIYVGVSGGIMKVDSSGAKSWFTTDLSSLGSNYIVSVTFDEAGLFGGDLFVSTLDNKIVRFHSDGTSSVFATGFNFGQGYTSTGDIVFGPDGYMYVAGGMDGTVWQIVPEPATLGLLGLGGLALLRRRTARR
jgi:WD40 repeat protein